MVDREAFRCLALALALAVAAACAMPETDPPQAARERGALLVENARVLGKPDADAILVIGGRVAKIGRTTKLRAWTAATSWDADGALVMPGFHDSHIHLASGGRSLGEADLAGARDQADVLARVRAWVEAHPAAPWIVGRGWSYDVVTAPTAVALDAVTGDRPAFLEAYDGHTAWVNTAALARAGIMRTTKDPPDGVIGRDERGVPNGLLLENAAALVRLPEPTRDETRAALAAGAMHAAAAGVSSVDDIEGDPEAFDLLLELDAAGMLPLRVRLFLPIEGDLAMYARMRARATPRVEIAGVKAFLDGVVESKTAYLLEPYATDARTLGAPLIEPARFEALVRAADANGFQVIVHAIGDAAVRLCLDTFAKLPADPPRGHRVEHVELLSLEDAPRFAAARAVASMQPYHAIPEAPDPDAGAWSENLGAARLPRTFAWKTLLDAGAELAFGSDWPVFTVDPFHGLAVAVTRRSESGFPVQGWNAHQAISLDAALAAYGVTPARLVEGTDVATLIVVDGVDLADPRTLWHARVRRLPPVRPID